MGKQSSNSNEHGAAAESLRAVDDDGLCPKCGYALRGLPAHGTCPECGAPYTPTTVKWLIQLPSALAICARFGWPILLIVGSTALIPFVRDFGIAWIFTSTALLIVACINSFIQVWLLFRRHLPPGRRRSERFAAKLHMLGPAVTALFYLCAIVPPLIVGGCVALMMGGGL